jgi:hypothetical protein
MFTIPTQFRTIVPLLPTARNTSAVHMAVRGLQFVYPVCFRDVTVTEFTRLMVLAGMGTQSGYQLQSGQVSSTQ